jgi:site-specific DNA recombinase
MVRKKDEPQAVIGYCRVSTEEQSREGVSMESQERKIRGYAEYNAVPSVQMFSDAGISGKRMHTRPGLLAALDAVCECRGALVVYSLSRLSRNKMDIFAIADRLKSAGADLVSLSEKIDTTTAAGRMIFAVLAVLADFERDQLSERTSNALQHKKTQGETISRDPFGYASDDGKLVPVPQEQAALKTIVDLRSAGMGARKIAHYLNDQGIPPKRGRVWHPSSVASVLKTSSTMPEEPCAVTT